MDSSAPYHVGFILDGNRRWAKKIGLTSLQGHRNGIENIKNIAEACLDHGVKVLTCYCFSTENWKRSAEEVTYLMELFEKTLKKYLDEFNEKNVCLRHLGVVSRLPESLVKWLKKAEDVTGGNDRLVVNLAINYGGRDEIVRAVNKIIARENGVVEITEELIGKNLDTGKFPDPDIIIRTSGEMRLSNFLIWQAAYSEFFFVEKCFPEFTKEDFAQVLDEFERRKRRFGGN